MEIRSGEKTAQIQATWLIVCLPPKVNQEKQPVSDVGYLTNDFSYGWPPDTHVIVSCSSSLSLGNPPANWSNSCSNSVLLCDQPFQVVS